MLGLSYRFIHFHFLSKIIVECFNITKLTSCLRDQVTTSFIVSRNFPRSARLRDKTVVHFTCLSRNILSLKTFTVSAASVLCSYSEFWYFHFLFKHLMPCFNIRKLAWSPRRADRTLPALSTRISFHLANFSCSCGRGKWHVFLDKSACWKADMQAFQQGNLSRKNLAYFYVHTSK